MTPDRIFDFVLGMVFGIAVTCGIVLILVAVP
jgi:hypothetical protein